MASVVKSNHKCTSSRKAFVMRQKIIQPLVSDIELLDNCQNAISCLPGQHHSDKPLVQAVGAAEFS